MNLLPARVAADNIELPFGDVALPGELRARLRQGPAVSDVIAGIRPEAFGDAAISGETAPGLRFNARIDVVEAMGPEVYAYFDVPCRLHHPADRRDLLEQGDGAALAGRGNVRQVVARLPVTSGAAAGQEATLTVDPAGLKLFDPHTGANLLPPAPGAGASESGVHPGAHTRQKEAPGDIAGRSAEGAP
jgi:multiple sugar transport system ATP-binding protein